MRTGYSSPEKLRAEALVRLPAIANQSIERALLACWRVLIGRIRGNRAQVVGWLASARKTPECTQTLGPLTRVLPAVGSIDWQESLRAVAAPLREVSVSSARVC
jgi:non-ribosomal peptide synthetase component F